VAVIHGVVVDRADPERVSAFWQAVLGYEYRAKGDGWFSLRNPAGIGPYLSFDTVPEGRVVKNRVRLDIRPEDRTRDEERARLEALGATTLRLVDDNPADVHSIMADPESDEFCILNPSDPTNRAPDDLARKQTPRMQLSSGAARKLARRVTGICRGAWQCAQSRVHPAS
jgi:Glyoxalase-like domain